VIANSVALSTLERRREIGIMKAVGLQRERVLGMLLLENGLMGIVGGLIGVGISFAAIVIMLRYMLEDQFGKAIPYGTAFTLMALCILISLGAAIVSVWGASGEKPLNVLRYE
jgi:putative ABC transport system permease protein